MDLTWIAILIWVSLLLLVGYLCPFIKDKHQARLIAWGIAITTAAFSSFFTSDQLPLMRMVIIVVLQLVSMKIVVVVETYSAPHRLTPIQWIAFSMGWFGMRPALFETFPNLPLVFTPTLWKGISRITIGIILLYLSILIEKKFQVEKIFLPQLLLLAGLSFILHFGFLNVSTALWRRFGVNVTELFQAPYKSKSLKEFWGRRWNIAFSEMTAQIAYRPLKSKVGIEKAVILSFLLSGLLHEIAISVPVMAGFGLPMIYFGIHAFAMHLESHSAILQKLLRRKWLAHIWVMSLLILPMPLLFHCDFIEKVLKPIRAIILQTFLIS